ncbi:hypothetical protein A5642_14700 [Mycolicibacterium mucogenicum]|uniref:Uncharacterized protein n=1 Tax=Mycolicibacterium mucogenicum TaxID=56689 RepID=A0A1A0MW95_MYCMU|nr:hypothetical protein [Mycolicibacterium mucogenicum]OBA89662.1 hypothetical protein A5642_14700 [Mycolicibacterium mucogenicum]
MTATATAAAGALPPAPVGRKLRWQWQSRRPAYRLITRWAIIMVCTGVAFHDSVEVLVTTTRKQGLAGYVWTVPLAAIVVTIGVSRRRRDELPIHDRQTDIIIGTMGLVLAVLIDRVLLPRFNLYYHLLHLDLAAMWLFVLSSGVLLFGLRPVSRFGWVWAMLFMVFPLPYYLVVVILGGGRFAAGAAALVVAGVGTGIAVGRTFRRGLIGSVGSWVVGLATLSAMAALFPEAPVLAYQLIPTLTAITGASLFMFFSGRRGMPKRLFDRTVAPVASNQVWGATILVVTAALLLALIPLPPQATSTIISRRAATQLATGRPLTTPPGWNTTNVRDYRWVHRFYGDNSVLVRQQMTADVGDKRFDKFGRPRTVVVYSLVSTRPFAFDVYPARVLYGLAQARMSQPRMVDIGHGVTGQLQTIVDDKRLITWTALRFAWGDSHVGQRISIFAVDDHEPDARFPEPSTTLWSAPGTLFTMLIRGNAVLDEHNSTFKDAALLTEFGRTLVAAQFATETTPT